MNELDPRLLLSFLAGGMGLAREPREAHVLASTVRLAMYRRILQEPGISLRSLARDVETTWSNVKYHSMRLEASGLIETRIVGRKRVCYAAGSADQALVVARAVLSEPTARRLAAYLAQKRPMNVAELARETGETQRVVYYHLKRFLDVGLLERDASRSYRRWRATPLLYAALE